MALPRLLVIEDGTEYREFAEMFLGERFEVIPARSAREALLALSAAPIAAMLVDLRFERAAAEDLTGDVTETAKRMFGGDVQRALRWLKDQQGTLVLKKLREAGHAQRAVFVHDFPKDRLANLVRLYGDVRSVPGFDADAIARALEGP
jgi:ActR/RegA family two-component response regulator